MREESTTHDER
ncbi:uncharacterized protein RMCB_0641, partial [Mycolicibacterium brisbanense]